MDPSLRNFGIVYGVVQGSTLNDVKFYQLSSEMPKLTPKYEAKFHRYCNLSIGLDNFVNNMPQLDRVFMEISTGSQDTSAAQAMAISTFMGSYISARLCPDTPVQLITPRMLKKHLLENSKADKDEIVDYLSTKFPDLPWYRKGGKVLKKNEHLADALAVLLWGLSHNGIEIKKALSNHSSPEWFRY